MNSTVENSESKENNQYLNPNFLLEETIEDLLITKNVREKVTYFLLNNLFLSDLIEVINKQYIQSTNLQICLPSIVELFLASDSKIICEHIVDKIALDKNQYEEIMYYVNDNGGLEEKSEITPWKLDLIKKWIEIIISPSEQE